MHMLVHVLPHNFARHLKHVFHVKWIDLSFKNVSTLTSSWNTTEAIMMRGDRSEHDFFHDSFDGLSQGGQFAGRNGLPIVFMDVFYVAWAASDNFDYIFKNSSFFHWRFVWKGRCACCIAAFLARLDSWNRCFLILNCSCWWWTILWLMLQWCYARLCCFIVCRFAWNLCHRVLIMMRGWSRHTILSTPWCSSCLDDSPTS